MSKRRTAKDDGITGTITLTYPNNGVESWPYEYKRHEETMAYAHRLSQAMASRGEPANLRITIRTEHAIPVGLPSESGIRHYRTKTHSIDICTSAPIFDFVE